MPLLHGNNMAWMFLCQRVCVRERETNRQKINIF